MNYKNLFYCLSCLSYATIVGAATYEHVAVIPQWAAAPPLSLAMFQGTYALNSAPFWQSIHPITLLLALVSLLLFWKTARRRNIAVVLITYVVILATTFTYFVPELLSIIFTPFSETVDASLVERAGRWETLSIIRLVVLIAMVVYLMMGLTRTERVDVGKQHS